jgi:hypothetical protein
MRSGIEQARLELARLEARMVEEETALATAERQVADIRERLADSVKCANGLRRAVQLWDAFHARNEPPSPKLS